MMLLYAAPTGKWKPNHLDSDEQLALKSVSSGKMGRDIMEYFKHESYPNLKISFLEERVLHLDVLISHMLRVLSDFHATPLKVIAQVTAQGTWFMFCTEDAMIIINISSIPCRGRRRTKEQD